MKKFPVIVIFIIILTCFAPCHASPLSESTTNAADKKPVAVTIAKIGSDFSLLRDGRPYFVKGVGGHLHLESAAYAGANAVRTWGADNADQLLDRAQNLGMTVMLGTWLSHDPKAYRDPNYRDRMTRQVHELVERHKNHPALLFWSLGNEINLQGADTQTAWRFVDELAAWIKQHDPLHPVVSVIAAIPGTLDHIAAWAPNLDAVGINVYGGLKNLRAMIDASAYQGPYLVTEWGGKGHWEVSRTQWGRPIEPTSTWKSDFQLNGYTQHILGNRDRCLGAYVFLWGQKQERTPTWYSMILDDLPGLTDDEALFSPAVDVMHYHWTGNWPANRSPELMEMQLNDQVAEANIVVAPGGAIVSHVKALDPENDPLTYVWELLEEPTHLGVGGSYEPPPARLDAQPRAQAPVVEINAPLKSGEYRLFVYVLDQQGHVATANIPFKVQSDFEQVKRQSSSDQLPPG